MIKIYSKIIYENINGLEGAKADFCKPKFIELDINNNICLGGVNKILRGLLLDKIKWSR